MDDIQKQIRGICKRIDPEYQPVLSPEIYQDKQILVILVPGGELRPYQAPIKLREKGRAYYVRQGSESVRAQGDVLTQLMQMTARVPFSMPRFSKPGSVTSRGWCEVLAGWVGCVDGVVLWGGQDMTIIQVAAGGIGISPV